MSSSDAAVRTIFRKHFRNLTKAMLTDGCFQNIEQFIEMMQRMLVLLRREARRKKRSRWYLEFCEERLAAVAVQPLGGMGKATGQELVVLDQMLRAFVNGMSGKPAPGMIDPKSFAALHKRIFVKPEPRGPKRRTMYDDAFARHRKGEPVSSIARDLDADRYMDDPAASIERFTKAFERRANQSDVIPKKIRPVTSAR
jgi:hypothetical protein